MGGDGSLHNVNTYLRPVPAKKHLKEDNMQPNPSPLVNLMPIFIIFIIFYFLLIRPQQKKQQEHQKMISELKKNDEVVTSGGIHGVVMNVKDNTVVVKIAEGVKIEVQKSSISALKKSA